MLAATLVATPMPMPVTPAPSRDQLDELARIARSGVVSVRLARRARTILMAADGIPDVTIADVLGVGRAQVARWRRRFIDGGLAGILRDRPRSGRPRKVGSERLLEAMRMDAAEGRSPTIESVARRCGVSEASVERERTRCGLARRTPTQVRPTGPRYGERPILLGLYVGLHARSVAVTNDRRPTGYAIDAQHAVPIAAIQGLAPSSGDEIAWLHFLERVARCCPTDRHVTIICDGDGAVRSTVLRPWLDRNPSMRFEATPSRSEWRRRVDDLLSAQRDASTEPDTGGDDAVGSIISTLLAYFTGLRRAQVPLIWVRDRQGLAAPDAARFCSSAGTGRDRRAA